MSEISNWILQITGIVLCGVLVEVLLPKGKLNKILKTILALFIVMVIIAPLKNSDIAKLNFSNIFGELNIDKSFVERREGEKIEVLEQTIEDSLAKNGYMDTKVNIIGEFCDEKLNIETVFVDLTGLVLLSDSLNINKYTNIVAVIKNLINISEENVIFYE